MNPGIGSVLGITFHRFTDHRQEVVSQHTVPPDDLCCGVAVPHYFQEIADSCCQDLFNFFYVPCSCPFLPQFRCGLNRCGIIGSQIDNDRIWLPCLEIIVLQRSQRSIPLPSEQSTDLCVKRRNLILHISIPSGDNSPAALGYHTILRG